MYRTEVIYGEYVESNFADLLLETEPELAKESIKEFPKIWPTVNCNFQLNFRILDFFTMPTVDAFLEYMENYNWGDEKVSWNRWGEYPVNSAKDYIISEKLEDNNSGWRSLFHDNGYEVPEWAENFVSSIEDGPDNLKRIKKGYLFVNLESMDYDNYPITREHLSLITGLLNYRYNRDTNCMRRVGDENRTPYSPLLSGSVNKLFQHITASKVNRFRSETQLFTEM